MKYICGINDTFLKNLVTEIVKAVTEDIILDIRNAGLQKSHINSYPTRVWDLINKNVVNVFENDENVIAEYTKRGPWDLIAIFNKPSGFLFTIMREERFKQIKKEKNMHHYVAHLSERFNGELPITQQCFWESNYDEDEVSTTIDRICKDLMISPDIVKNHALVLFSAKNEILSYIRLVMINCNFEECESLALDKYITVEESIVVEQIDSNSSMNPTEIKLSYKNKAKEKQGLDHTIKQKEDAGQNKGEA